jgi:hypothetical protein
MSITHERLVSDALDREAIRDVMVRYLDAVWRDDIDAVVQLFSADGTIVALNDPVGGSAPVGHEQLHAFHVARVRKMTARPFGHNHVVDLHGDGRASGRTYVELRSSMDYTWIGAVIYIDEYVKVGGTWKIRRREARMQNLD